MPLTLKQGSLLVKTARKAISLYAYARTILSDEAPLKEFNEKKGVFTSIHSYPEKLLRGCIGFSEPIMPLWNALIHSAINAGFKDPRFKPLSLKELDKIVLEVSILSKPAEIRVSKKDLEKSIKIGRDGLIIKKGFQSALLLPQVAIEQKWNAKEFLRFLCLKAGLKENEWQKENTKIFSFQTQIFKELKPNGKIVEEFPKKL
jgi:hypothetical protein